MEITTAKENGDDDDTSTKMAMMENIIPKQDKHLRFMERIKWFHGRKYSRRYDFKIILEACKIVLMFFPQHFQLFLRKMVLVDPCFMILP